MTKLGTMTWLEATQGRLRFQDKLHLLAQGVLVRAATLRARKNLHTPKIRHLEVDEILPPDTPAAKEALLLCEQESDPFLVNHCLRSYLWARLLLEPKTPFDDEAAYCAIMLHDMGLTHAHRLKPSQPACFTYVGATFALELAKKHQWSDAKANVVADAISLHLNVVIPKSTGPEALMVRTGSGADVAGLRMHELPEDQIQEVCQKHPRLQMKRRIKAVLDEESRNHPCCRIAFLNRRLQFGDYITSAPMFSE